MSILDDVALSLLMTLIIAGSALLTDSETVFCFFVVAAGIMVLQLYYRIRRI